MNHKKELQRQLEVITTYLTREEAETVLPLYKKYYTRGFANIDTTEVVDPNMLITHAFYWEGTKEGYEYWRDISSTVAARYLSINQLKTT